MRERPNRNEESHDDESRLGDPPPVTAARTRPRATWRGRSQIWH